MMEGEGEFRGRMGVWRGKLTAVEGGAWVELGHQLRAAGTCPDPAWLDPGMSVSWVGSRMQLAGPRMGAPTRSLAMLTTLGMRPLAEGGLRRRGADWWCVHCLRHSLALWHSLTHLFWSWFLLSLLLWLLLLWRPASKRPAHAARPPSPPPGLRALFHCSQWLHFLHPLHLVRFVHFLPCLVACVGCQAFVSA